MYASSADILPNPYIVVHGLGGLMFKVIVLYKLAKLYGLNANLVQDMSSQNMMIYGNYIIIKTCMHTYF